MSYHHKKNVNSTAPNKYIYTVKTTISFFCSFFCNSKNRDFFVLIIIHTSNFAFRMLSQGNNIVDTCSWFFIFNSINSPSWPRLPQIYPTAWQMGFCLIWRLSHFTPFLTQSVTSNLPLQTGTIFSNFKVLPYKCC